MLDTLVTQIMPFAIAIFMSLFGGALTWWISRRTRASLAEIETTGDVFPVLPIARGVMLGLIGLFIIIELIIGAAYLTGGLDTGLWGFILFHVIIAPLYLMVFYLLIHNSGFVILSDDAVTVRWMGRTKSMKLADIERLKQRDFNVPPNMVLIGKNGQRLRINRRTVNLHEIYLRLMEASPTLQAQLKPTFPFKLRVKLRSIAGTLIQVAFLFGIWVLISLAPLLTMAENGDTFGWDVVQDILFFFALLGLIFGTGIVAGVLELVKIKKPIAWTFTESEISMTKILGGKQAFDAATFNKPEVKQTLHRGRAKGITVETMRYSLVLTVGGESFEIDDQRIRQFGYDVQELAANLQRLYQT